jgi:hypothetical protein
MDVSSMMRGDLIHPEFERCLRESTDCDPY